MKIEYNEMKELHVYHIYKVERDELAKICIARPMGARPLYWHDGILFLFDELPLVMNNELVSDFIKGKEHWQEAYYAEMPNYREYIELEDGDFKGAKVRIINAKDFTPHSEFASWVKGRKRG